MYYDQVLRKVSDFFNELNDNAASKEEVIEAFEEVATKARLASEMEED